MPAIKPANIILQVIDLIHNAGELLLDFYHQTTPLEITQKSNHTPVTNADLALSDFLTTSLKKLTPNIPVLSEEDGAIPLAERQGWQRYWLIDPLDGTQQFIKRTGKFAILIALMERTNGEFRPVLGAIHLPLMQTTFYATQGNGAFKQSPAGTAPLQPRPIQNPIRIAIGSHSTKRRLEPLLNPDFEYEFKIVGSSGVKSALVADNIADCYVRLGDTGEWDTAAAEIILQEIGGAVLDFSQGFQPNQPLTYNARESLINPNFIMLGNQNSDFWQDVFLR